MKAMIYQEFGPPDVMELRDIDKPPVEDDEILVRLHAAAVNPQDWHCLRGTPFLARLMVGGLLKPGHQVLGSDVAGRVEAVGVSVSQFQPGDEVFGLSFRHGGFAEYVCLPAAQVVQKKPARLSFEEAAAVPAASLMALMGLRDKGQIKPGQKVLINGASGGIGTFAVQIAKSFGAEVTGVCSTRNLELVHSIGADRVIDYTREDFTQGAERYDLIFDVVAKRSFSDCRRALSPKGIYVTTAFSLALVLLAGWTSLTGGKRMVPMLTKPKQEDLAVLKELIEIGDVAPVIDRRYTLSEVPEAIRYLEKGHARGKVVVTVTE